MGDTLLAANLNRRVFLKTMAAGMVVAGCGRQLLRAAETAAGRKPNIVFILADDLGWRDVACNGSRYYETPHIDRLAAQGMRFTDAYSAAPMCVPTRASLLTGQSPARLNITEVTDWRKGKLKPQPWDSSLPLETTTIAEELKTRGYVCGHVGKWHVGKVEREWPEAHGFDLNVSGCNLGAPPSYFSPYQNPRLKDGPAGEYLTDRLTDEALKFIADNKERPFLLHLWHYAPHVPIQAKEALIEKFRNKRADGLQDDPVYAAMMTSLDESVGRVLAALDQHGLADNTVVIFTSDNGGLDRRVKHHASGKPGPTCNAPLREGKGTLYEGGVRVPMIIRWRHVKPGTVSSELICSWDIFPTLLAISGAPANDPKIDGEDLRPILTGQGKLNRDFVAWHYPHYGNYHNPPAGAIRVGNWKLIEFFEDGRTELYDLAKDLSETHDLAAEQPAKVKELQGRLTVWQKTVGARLPVPNPDFGVKTSTKPAPTSD